MRKREEERDGLDEWKSSQRSGKEGDKMRRRGGRRSRD